MEVIAEIGLIYDGSIGELFNICEAVCKTKVDTVKFQHHLAEIESSEHEKFRINFSYVDKTRKEYWKRNEIGIEFLSKLKNLVESYNKNFLCTPFSMEAIDQLISIDVQRFKIGSGDIINDIMLSHINKFGKPVILSNGTRNIKNLKHAISLLNQINDITIMHCTSKYPTPLKDINLLEISNLKKIFKTKVGISDHSGTIWPSIFSSAIGGDACEVHVCWDKRQFAPDSSSSLTIDELCKLIEGLKAFDLISQPYENHLTEKMKRLQNIFSRSTKFRENIKKGEKLSVNQIETFKPSGLGLSPGDASKYVGKKLNKDVVKFDPILGDEFE